MKKITANKEKVAYCGLCCGACGAYLKGCCPVAKKTRRHPKADHSTSSSSSFPTLASIRIHESSSVVGSISVLTTVIDGQG